MESRLKKLLKIDFQWSKLSRVSFWVSCLGGGSFTYDGVAIALKFTSVREYSAKISLVKIAYIPVESY